MWCECLEHKKKNILKINSEGCFPLHAMAKWIAYKSFKVVG